MKLLQQLNEVKTASKPKSIQAAIREIMSQYGAKWRPGWSRAYKDRSPNGSIRVKMDSVNVPTNKKDEQRLEQALQALPKATDAIVLDTSGDGRVQISVWFSEEPGVGKSISEKQYQTRLNTAAKSLRGLMTAAGKDKRRLFGDLHKLL